MFSFQMFMTSVLWSDQNDIAIYRKLEDFKKMHVSMTLNMQASATLSRTYVLIHL